MCDIEDLVVSRKMSDDNWNAIVSELDNKRIDIKSDKDLIKFRLSIQRKYKIVISNSDMIKAYNALGYDHPEFKYVLTKKKNKSNSGVVVITVLTSAHPSYIDDDGIEKKAAFSGRS